MDLFAATEAFMFGFGTSRALHGPWLVEPHGEGHLCHDPTGSRAFELVGVDLPPAFYSSHFPRERRGFIAAMYQIGTPLLSLKRSFREQGFRLLRNEPLFVHDLNEIVPPASPVARVHTGQELETLSRFLRKRPDKLGVDLVDDAKIRHYYAGPPSNPDGHVRAIQTVHGASWVSTLWVSPDRRRQGVATRLMRQLLLDDARLGRTASVLLASNLGAQLYPTLGYRQLGTLMLLAPIKEKRS